MVSNGRRIRRYREKNASGGNCCLLYGLGKNNNRGKDVKK
jgi:hypothetical protein